MSEQPTGNQLFASLVNMRNAAGEAAWERVRIAAELLSIREWVVDPAGGGGAEDVAIRRLEEDCFGDLCGAIPLVRLLEMHRRMDLTQWRRHRFNLSRIWAAMKVSEPPRKAKEAEPNRRVAGMDALPSVADFKELPRQEMPRHYRAAVKEIDAKDERIAELEADNRRLRERVKELERQLDHAKRLRGGVAV